MPVMACIVASLGAVLIAQGVLCGSRNLVAWPLSVLEVEMVAVCDTPNFWRMW